LRDSGSRSLPWPPHTDIHLNASGYAVVAAAVDAALPPADEED
jgi:hypothetical protein